MATYYAVAAGGNWSAGATWSTTGSGGAADGATPTAADNCILEAGSGNVVIDSGATRLARSLNCTGYTGTLTHAASTTLQLGDATAGPGNVILKFDAGMTYSFGANAQINLYSTNATAQTVTTAGKTLGYTQIGVSSTSNIQLADAWTSVTEIWHILGTFDTNGQTVSTAVLRISGSATRVLTLGNSAITLTSATPWVATNTTGLTVTANTATVTCTGAAAVFDGGSFNWNGMSLVMSGSGAQNVTAGGTFANFTRTGTAVKTGSLTLTTSGITCTGTCTLTGNSASANRLLVASATLGTARTITAAAVSLTNVDFRDITGAGAATWSGTSIGNALGNSGITFTTPVTVTHNSGAAGNWSTAANWDTGKVPLCHDTVVIPATTTGTLTADMPRIGADVSFASGFAGTFTISGTIDVGIYGSLSLASGMATSVSGYALLFYGRSSHTLTTNGVTMTFNCHIYAVVGTYTLGSAFTNNRNDNRNLYLLSGTFSDGGFAVSLTGGASSFGQLTGTLNATSTWTIASTTAATPWQYIGGTVNHTGTIVLSGATATDRTFAGGGKTYGTLTDQNTSTGKLTITGANTFGTINKTATVACTLTLPTSSGITVTGQFNVNGVAGQLLTLTGDVTKASGNVICSYLNISSSDAAGGATFYAGRTSTDGGGNTGWLFVDYVTGTASGSGTGGGTATGIRTVLGVASGSGTGGGSAVGGRTVLGVATGSGTGAGSATGRVTVFGVAVGAGTGGGYATGGQVDPDDGLCGYWLQPADLRPNGCAPCASVTADDPTDALINDAILAASEYLNAATSFQFPGICETTVRPCGGEEGFGFGGIFGWSEIPFYLPAGVLPAWWSGCGCGYGCDCCGPPAISLGKIPVVAVSEVKLDGEILEAGVDYVMVGDLLARLDPDGEGNNTWPSCQNIALSDDEPGTMSVTFTWGAMPPELGRIAARDLACMLIKEACTDDCQPSERMVQRQAGGTTVQLISPDGDVRTSMPRTVKMFIDAYGPTQPSMRTFPKVRRPRSGAGLIVGPYDWGSAGWQRAGFGGNGCPGC